MRRLRHSKTKQRLGLVAAAVSIGLLAVAGPALAAQPAALTIGVSPSPNGLVMVGVASQIAVAGTPRANLDLWDATQKKYFRIGTATPKKALAYTFQAPGLQRIRMVPAKGKAKTFVVAVYQRYPGGSTTPTNYGGTILTSADGITFLNSDDNSGPENQYTGSRTISIPADRGCVLVDMGLSIRAGARAPATATVRSTGAPPATLTAQPGQAVAMLSIPVKGDIVADASGPVSVGLSATAGGFVWGRGWTCLKPG